MIMSHFASSCALVMIPPAGFVAALVSGHTGLSVPSTTACGDARLLRWSGAG